MCVLKFITTIKKLACLTCLFLLGISCLASEPPFQASYNILGYISIDSNVAFRVIGDIVDDSPLGFSIYNVATNDYVFCNTPNGDIDRYRITSIVNITGNVLTCDIRYDEPGYPRYEAPGSGFQIICNESAVGAIYIPSLTYGLITEYLYNGARNQVAEKSITTAASKWSLYPATTNVDLNNKDIVNVYGINLRGDYRTNWPSFISDISKWSEYPATQNVNIANNNLTNVAGLTLNGEYRTNWPNTANLWSEYSASQDVNLNNHGLTNVIYISLGGIYRTNWPNTANLWSEYSASQDVNLDNHGLTNVIYISLGGIYRTNWPWEPTDTNNWLGLWKGLDTNAFMSASKTNLDSFNNNAGFVYSTLKIGDTTTEENKVYQLQTDNTWIKANNINATNCSSLLGISLGTNSGSSGILLQGILQVTNNDLIVGASLFVDSIDGNWTQTLPTNLGYVIRQIGYAEATNKICVVPNGTYVVIGEYFDPYYNYVFALGTTQTFDTAAANKIILNGEVRTNWASGVTSHTNLADINEDPNVQHLNAIEKSIATNPPSTNGLASTNWVIAQGYATPIITNGLASTNWVTYWVGLQGYVTATITNGLASTNWVLSLNYKTDSSDWSYYPALSNVNFNNREATNLTAITLNGERRTNWATTVTIPRGIATGGLVSNVVTYPTPTTNIPYVVITLSDVTIDQLVVPEIIQRTTNGFSWRIRTAAGLSTNTWQINWIAVE